MHGDEILMAMRTGEEQPDSHIEAFVQGVVAGTVSRPQAAAWLAYAFQRGLSDAETLALTRAMTYSGGVMEWSEGPRLTDKHSTGGVGDKISLILAPLWVALGYRVPMIAGRGLGHTGGTLDKLEAIPGYRCDLTQEELHAQLDAVGGFISGQTAELAPADRVLYALRNEVACVESIPLITGSILSKKLAEGVERLVLDVKCGSGAFMKDVNQATDLAEMLVRVARMYGVDCTALVTAMDRPLGRAVGNSVEVVESIEVLKGGGPADVRELTLTFADHPDAEAALDDGRALEAFRQIVIAQGGDPEVLDDPAKLLGAGVREDVLVAERDGVVQQVHAYKTGRAAFVLGAGRQHSEDAVDFGVGLWVEVKPGDHVVKGQPLVRILHRDGRELQRARRLLQEAIQLGDGAGESFPLVIRKVG